MQNIYNHDKFLVELAFERMRKINDLEIYGSLDQKDRLAVISFNVKGMGCHAVAKVLSLRENIMIRSGFHCAQPLHDRLGIGPSARVSFYLYNTKDEIDVFAELLGKLAQFIWPEDLFKKTQEGDNTSGREKNSRHQLDRSRDSLVVMMLLADQIGIGSPEHGIGRMQKLGAIVGAVMAIGGAVLTFKK